jgi:hypothetical protein
VTTTPGSGPSTFTANFASAGDFYNRFWTYTGNYCTNGTTCRWSEGHGGVISYNGDHDMACGVPTTQRSVRPDVHNENFWWCAPNGPDTGHLMLAMSTHSYSISGFTPRQAFTDVTSVCWDMSLTDLGGGKWFTVTLVPAAVLESHPNTNPRRVQELEGPYRLDYTLPEFDADGGPGDFNLQRQPRWMFKLFRTQLATFDRVGGTGEYSTFSGFVAGNDKATRYRHCLTENAAGDVIVTQNGRSFNTGTSFPDGEVYVIFADDTYDDLKHDGTPNKTWHIDTIQITYST